MVDVRVLLEHLHRTGHSRQSAQRDCIWYVAHAISTKRHTMAAKSGPGLTDSVLPPWGECC